MQSATLAHESAAGWTLKREAIAGIRSKAGRLALLQSLVAISLSYALLFSEDAVVPRQLRELFVMGLMVSVVALLVMPRRLLGASWFISGLVVTE